MIHGPDPGAAQPKQAAGLWGGVLDQMGGEASSELGAPTPCAPVNLCPESVTSSRCGSLPGAKNSSFSFESFLVPGCLGPPGLPISRRPAEKKRGGPQGRAARKARPPVRLLYPCAKGERARRPTGAWGAGLTGLSELLLNAQEVKLVVLGAELGRLKKERERERETARSLPKATQFENSRSAIPAP